MVPGERLVRRLPLRGKGVMRTDESQSVEVLRLGGGSGGIGGCQSRLPSPRTSFLKPMDATREPVPVAEEALRDR